MSDIIKSNSQRCAFCSKKATEKITDHLNLFSKDNALYLFEKHFKLTDDSGSEDDAFSLNPTEFKQMVDSIRIVEKTLGAIHYDGVNSESKSKKFRRSLFIVKDVKKGDFFTEDNIKSIRPSNGLHTRFYKDVLGKKSRADCDKGTPLSWDIIE